MEPEKPAWQRPARRWRRAVVASGVGGHVRLQRWHLRPEEATLPPLVPVDARTEPGSAQTREERKRMREARQLTQRLLVPTGQSKDSEHTKSGVQHDVLRKTDLENRRNPVYKPQGPLIFGCRHSCCGHEAFDTKFKQTKHEQSPHLLCQASCPFHGRAPAEPDPHGRAKTREGANPPRKRRRQKAVRISEAAF
ncbi:MAG: hypothetical protein MHM6MM_000381 [Cercozoa sp. M6MM]